ncbi:PAS domain-containing protein [Massilia niastensis]|uniref:PAS domain-containing protein n=1 Tax=Massilia niastensis TaxID=544911 RepID=UPI00036046ED|nr:PAS domain-containing protein [Massilia niastensis]
MPHEYEGPPGLNSLDLGWKLFEASSDCVKVLSLDGRVLAMNRHGLRAMEIDSFSACAGRPWKAFWPAHSHADIDAAIAAAIAGGTGRFKASCPTAKGRPAWWDVVVTSVSGMDGQAGNLLAVR